MRQHREFNSNAESEGAPVECRHAGYTPRILVREDGKLFGVVRESSGLQRAMEWRSNGCANWHNNDIDLVLAPIDWVQGQPVYHGDVVYKGRRKVAVNASQMGDAPPWAGATLAPVEPQIVSTHDDPFGQRGGHPLVETRMTRDDLKELAEQIMRGRASREPGDGYVLLANAILSRALADGQVVPADKPQISPLSPWISPFRPWNIKFLPEEAPAPVGSELWKARQEKLARISKMRAEILNSMDSSQWSDTLLRALADPDAQRLDAAIEQVQTAAPRIQLEQVAAQMQQAIVRQLLAEGKELGWTGRETAAGIVRRMDINPVVDRVLGVQS